LGYNLFSRLVILFPLLAQQGCLRKMTYCWRPTRGPVQAHILWSALALFFACFPCALRSNAQDTQDNPDVAETARQEKARKPTESKSHVYTNDDLQKPHILNEQDRARVEARKKSAPPPQTLEPAPSLDANDDSPAESLGEVARRYRREKAADFAEQASRRKPPSPFPMDLSQPTFAAPAPIGPPLSSPHAHAPLAPVAPPVAASKPRVGLAPLKRDPFSRPALSPSLRVPNPGPAPLILAPVKPSPVAPSAAVPVLSKRPHGTLPAFAVVPVPAAKPAPVLSPPPLARIAPAKPAMISPPLSSLLPAPPTSSVAPAISRDSKITVRPGDSLWKLSRRLLGAGSRWQDWLSVNPGLLDPHAVQPGMILVVPRATAPASAASAKVLVRQGDSLWKIADTHYGNGAEWQCIATANSALSDPDQIYPGQVLVLPADCSSSQISKVSR
jgi:nucleoid-associated protein YgaU